MKKIVSVLMVAVLLVSATLTGNVLATEPDGVETPVFEVTQQESANGYIKLCFSLKSGSFNSLDINFVASKGLSCYDISTSPSFAEKGWAATNKNAKNDAFNISLVCTDGFSVAGPVFYVTYLLTDSGLNNYSVAFNIGDCTVTHTVDNKVQNTRVDPISPVFSRNNVEIRVAANPFVTTYCKNQPIDSRGLSVYALTLNGKKEILSDYSLSYDFSTAGQKVVTVCYLKNNFYAEATFEVTIKEHIPGEAKKVKDPTCSEPGLNEFYCTECSQLCETGPIDKLAHKLSVVTHSLPTYKTAGENHKKCTVCGHVDTVIPVAKLSADIDGDKKVTSKDALTILQHATGLKELKGTALKNADLNGSGSVFSDDALIVLQLTTGIITA